MKKKESPIKKRIKFVAGGASYKIHIGIIKNNASLYDLNKKKNNHLKNENYTHKICKIEL